MNLEGMIKNGWFSNQDLELHLSDDQVAQIKAKRRVMTYDGRGRIYHVSLRFDADINNLKEKDILIGEIRDTLDPYSSRLDQEFIMGIVRERSGISSGEVDISMRSERFNAMGETDLLNAINDLNSLVIKCQDRLNQLRAAND